MDTTYRLGWRSKHFLRFTSRTYNLWVLLYKISFCFYPYSDIKLTKFFHWCHYSLRPSYRSSNLNCPLHFFLKGQFFLTWIRPIDNLLLLITYQAQASSPYVICSSFFIIKKLLVVISNDLRYSHHNTTICAQHKWFSHRTIETR